MKSAGSSNKQLLQVCQQLDSLQREPYHLNRQRISCSKLKMYNKAQYETITTSKGLSMRLNWSVTLLLGVLVLFSSTEGSNITFPPLFNAALQADVILDPPDAICGINGRDQIYCASFDDHTSIDACRPADCSLKCERPERNQLTYPIITFDKVDEKSRSASRECITVDQTEQSGSQQSGTVFHFKGLRGPSVNSTCHLDLIKDWVVNLILFQVWSTTITVWIKPNNTLPGTLLVLADQNQVLALRLYINSQSQLGVDTGQQVVTRSDWTLPQLEWTFLAVTVENSSVSVYFNGSLIGDTVYGVNMQPPRGAKQGRIGGSFTGSDYFVGYLRNLQMFVGSISNREVRQVHTGVLPPLRVLSECRCPAGYANLHRRDTNLCVANPGSGRPSESKYRISPKAFPVQYVNDGRNDTKWLSSIKEEETTLTITLNQTYEIYRVAVVMYSPPPNYLRLEKRVGNSPWQIWHHFATDCQSRELPTDLVKPDDVICQPIAAEDDAYPYTGAQLVFDIQSRMKDSGRGNLGAFTRVSAVRFLLSGHLETIADDRHKYHSVQEILVQSLCECNGHGIDCDRSKDPYQCICSAQSYTRGRQCTECVSGAYRIRGRPVSDALYCQACDCFTQGTVGASNICQTDGGQCDCKANVEGRRCDKCRVGYYNLNVDNEKGCDPCGCNRSGVKGGSLSCHYETGQCDCKLNVIGRTCDLCEDGYYDLQEGNENGCKKCDCYDPGTEPDSTTCDKNTGQCMCKRFVEGQTCNRCKDGYYDLTKNNMEGCLECGCDMRGSVNASCDNDSGQCYCKANVIGRTCNKCAEGYYAIDDNDFRQNGCTHQCNCNVTGSLAATVNTCEEIGGQCACKDNVGGRACNRCNLATYGFGLSIEKGCLPCDCDERGVVTSANICDGNTGQCDCKKNVEGQKCSKCKVGTYNLRQVDPDGCKPCECYKYGVLPNEHCDRDTGACACKPGAGNPEVTGYTCYPYINPKGMEPPGVKPTRGPESGGTRVTIRGGYFGAVLEGLASVIIDPKNRMSCNIIPELSNDTTIICVTESLRKRNLRNLIDRTLPAKLVLPENDLSTDLMDFTYTYLEDPNIMTVRPLSTIQTGGLRMTVTGTNLDAVEEPRLLVHMLSFGNKTIFESKCEAFPEKLICPTPNLHPKDPKDEEEITTEDPTEAPGDEDGDEDEDEDASVVRTKRSAENEESEDDALNNEDTQFYFGFAFDDANLYNNITEDMPDIGQLIVYRDPEFRSFTERDQVKVFQPYWPFSHKNLVLHGKRLNLAASAGDFRVTIGKSYCDEIQLTTNRLTCVPPKRQPDAESKELEKKGAPHVQVDVGNIELLIGFMKYEHNFWENIPFRWGVIGGLIFLLLLMLLIILCICCIKKRRRKEEERAKHPHLYMRTVKPNNYISAYNTVSSAISTDTYMVAATDLLMLLPEDLRHKVTTCLIEPSRMEIGKVIGQGHYGRVYLGRLADKRNEKTIDVAIKTLREYHISPQNVVDFLEEATIMKDFDHEHVLNMYGVAIDENNRAYVLLPYMANGDLKAYVADDNNMLRVGELIDFGLQVADGMCYLSERKFIHRDLAARNCMVDSSGVVKIADFGLSCDLFENDYYRSGEEKRPLPVKWMALESLEYKMYSSKSDVWSFGVLLWELLTRGCTPYPDVDSYDIKNYLISGNRMDKPDFAPQDIYQLMTECWELSPENRPTFREIAVRLTRFLEENNTSTTHRRHTARYVRPRSLHDQQMTMTLDLLP